MDRELYRQKLARKSKLYAALVWNNLLRFRSITSRFRCLPGALIIGARRGGTTSAFYALKKHPCIAACFNKEPCYFLRFTDLKRYRSMFPLRVWSIFSSIRYRRNQIGLEASASYIASFDIAEKFYRFLPNLKIIIFLRNPADRAYSHYMLRTAQGYEKLSFKDALYQEKLSYTGSLEEEFSNLDIGKFIAKDSKVRTYLLEGCYLPQIKKWYSVFGKDDILIIQSENWFKNSDLVFKQILEFLGLPFYKLDELKKTGSAATIPMDQATREELVDFYRPYNARLFDFLGHSFEWD